MPSSPKPLSNDPGMFPSATVVDVMITSPSDSEAFHEAVRRAINRWNNLEGRYRGTFLNARAAKTDLAPEVAARTQDIPNRRILPTCHLLIAIFWARIGTATNLFESGTVEEIARHFRAKKRVMIYFADAVLRPSSIDLEQLSRVRKFKDKWSLRAWVQSFVDEKEFETLLHHDLEIVMNEDFSSKSPPSHSAPQTETVSGSTAQVPKPKAPPAPKHGGSGKDIEAEMAEWLIFADQASSPEDWQLIDRAIQRSPRHRAAFLRLSVAWTRSDSLRKLRPLDGRVDPDMLAPGVTKIPVRTLSGRCLRMVRRWVKGRTGT